MKNPTVQDAQWDFLSFLYVMCQITFRWRGTR